MKTLILLFISALITSGLSAQSSFPQTHKADSLALAHQKVYPQDIVVKTDDLKTPEMCEPCNIPEYLMPKSDFDPADRLTRTVCVCLPQPTFRFGDLWFSPDICLRMSIEPPLVTERWN